MGNTSISELDRKGRLTLPNELRDSLGLKKVLVIKAGDHIKLIPLPSDPFKELNGVLDVRASFRRLRKKSEKLAAKEASGDYRLASGK